jgi:lipopolysaccharide transport system ATP-binding protein
MSDQNRTVIRAVNITKEYKIDYSGTTSFKELLMQKIFRVNSQNRYDRKILLALNDISFEVKQGEALGIIGKNGAGKSTLLKVLSGITKPSSGKMEIYGRMSSILDIGVGFHPELTGRENIYLSGELNGLTRKEIRKNIDEIIDFSGVEKFIDTPVKYYSGGMFIRLAFSVISNIDSDILLLDEVLSVGDASFQMKSFKKLQSMFGQEKTIVMVSHNPADIVKLCSRVIVLDNGKIVRDGVSGKIVTDYTEESIIDAMDLPNEVAKTYTSNRNEVMADSTLKLESVVQWSNIDSAPGNELFRVTKIEIRAENKSPDEGFSVEDKLIIQISFWKALEDDIIDVGFVLNQFRNVVFASNTSFTSGTEETKGKGFFIARTIIPPRFLNNSIYSLDIHALHGRKDIVVNLHDIIFFVIHESVDPLINSIKKHFPEFPGPVRPILIWEVIKTEST